MVATRPAPIEDLRGRARGLGARNPTYYDVDGATHGAWGISGHPTILVVDGKRTVVREVDWVAMVSVPDDGGSPDSWRPRLKDELAAALDALLR